MFHCVSVLLLILYVGLRVLCFHVCGYLMMQCEPMPNVMAALPNIGGTLFSTPQSLADAHY